ncbi:MAG: hypothetical protein JOY54_03090 [Acidobacteriaceae bacterium]|nr:hypothetical protein [Acidobacteriaceae bacterium]
MSVRRNFWEVTRNITCILLLPVGVHAYGNSGLINNGEALTCPVGKTCKWAVKPGTSVHFVGNSGSLTCSPNCDSAESVTYTAPVTYTPQNVSVGGCPVLPNDTVWNTPIDKLPVHPNSATWIDNLHKTTPATVYGTAAWGVTVTTFSGPTKALTMHYAPANTPTVHYPFSQVGNLDGTMMKRENGNFLPAGMVDQHVMAVLRDKCWFYESYNDLLDDVTDKCHSDGRTICNASSGISYTWSNYQRVDPVTREVGTDAAGFPLAPLIPHLSEFKSGAIHHAMRFTGCVGCNSGAIWPSYNPAPGTDPKSWGRVPPYGARLRLNADWYAKNKANFSPGAQVFLTALADYGMFLSDIGSNFEIPMDTDLNLDPVAMAALKELHVPTTAFDVVDESSLIMPNSGGQSIEVNPANEYNPPVNYAVLALTQGKSNAVMVPIAVQPVTIGVLTGPRLIIQAGMSAYQLVWWVNGTSNQKVNWSLVSGVGSVSTNGAYRPPATTDGGTAAVLKGTSAADPHQSVDVYVSVIPGGTIRIDTGSKVPTKDGNGNAWLADAGLIEAAYYQQLGDYPNWPWFDMPGHSAVERAQYQTMGYDYGYDLVYKLIVPNGNYSIRLMFGQNRGNCGQNCTKHEYHSPTELESNGQIFIHDFSFEAAANYMPGIPQDAHIAARVTNNILYVALRSHRSQGDKTRDDPMLSGVVISPDTSTAPHWVIDAAFTKLPFGQFQTAAYNTTGTPGGLNTVPPGGSLNLYVVDVFTGDADVTTPNWTIVKGPGSLKPGKGFETYIPPAKQDSGEETAVIRAKGARHSAEITIHIKDVSGSNSQ